MLAASRAFALADDATRLDLLSQRFGTRLSPAWTTYKALRWRAGADPAAAAGYVAMFARDGLPDPTARITVPVLAVTGEQDAPPMRRDAVTRAWGHCAIASSSRPSPTRVTIRCRRCRRSRSRSSSAFSRAEPPVQTAAGSLR
jgi:hypothetical protein